MSPKKHFRVFIPKIIGGLLAALVIFFVVRTILHFINEKPEKSEKKIQPITILKPPPPPPKIEKPPPPPPPEVKQKIEEPVEEEKPLPDTPDEAPARDLGLDAEGTAGSDGFGLAARKGGTGLFGGGDPFARYGGLVRKEILALLSSHDELRQKSYTASIKLWAKSDGSVDRIELAKGSNDAEIDEKLTRILDKYKRISEQLPPGITLPIKFKIQVRI